MGAGRHGAQNSFLMGKAISELGDSFQAEALLELSH